jgi:hypothetical protein
VRNHQEQETGATSRIRRWLADPEGFAAAAAGSGDPGPLLVVRASATIQTTDNSEESWDSRGSRGRWGATRAARS